MRCLRTLHRSAPVHPVAAWPRAALRRATSGAAATPHADGAAAGRAESTHFGFQTVHASDKASMVGDVFRRVADNYDIMNDLMSGTLHRFWKDEFVRAMGPVLSRGDERTIVLDVAGGTGDIAFRVMDSMRASLERPKEQPHVIVCDINPAMLQVGQQRAQSLGYADSSDPEAPAVSWVHGDAEALPIASNSIDLYTIAFGIRNVTHVDAALRDAYRVLRPGGRFMCLEFSQVHTPGLREVYDAYSFNVIPLLGQLIANDRAAYQYLVESIRRFPDQERFAAMIREAGFEHVGYQNYTAGVCAVHWGFKLPAAAVSTPSVERDLRSGW